MVRPDRKKRRKERVGWRGRDTGREGGRERGGEARREDLVKGDYVTWTETMGSNKLFLLLS